LLKGLNRADVGVIGTRGVAGVDHVGVLGAFAGVVGGGAAVEDALDGCDAGIEDAVGCWLVTCSAEY